MPRVPKNPPAWLNTFLEYAREKEKRGDGKRALEKFEEVLEKRWEKFVDKMHEDAPEPKRRKVDPMKSLGNAMKKVAAQVDEVGDDPDQISEFRDRLMETLPPQVQSLLQPALPQDVVEQINQLCDQTAASKVTLEQTASADPVAQNALAIVDRVCDGLHQIKASLESNSDPEESGSEEDGDDQEDDNEEEDEEPAPEEAQVTVPRSEPVPAPVPMDVSA